MRSLLAKPRSGLFHDIDAAVFSYGAADSDAALFASFNSSSGAASLAAPSPQPPVALVDDHSVLVGRWAQVASWIVYVDSAGAPAVTYQFYDNGFGTGSGQFWTVDGSYQAAGTVLSVNSAELAGVWIGGAAAAGTEEMFVRAFNGASWSTWDSFNLVSEANSAPTVTIADHSLAVGHWDRVDSLFSASDADGDALTMYQFYDAGSASGSSRFWTASGGYQAANTTLSVTAADLHDVWIGGATATGTETMFIRAFDGSDWSTWESFDFTAVPNTPPVVNVADESITVGRWDRVENLFSVSDADGDATTMYQFYDAGSAAGSSRFWTASGGYQAADTVLTAAPAELHGVWIGGATAAGTDSMFIRALDGLDWSAWTQFDFTAQPNTPPTAMLGGANLFQGQWMQLHAGTGYNNVNYADADGDAAVVYQFYDEGNAVGGGKIWTAAHGYQAPDTILSIAAGDIESVWVGGAADYTTVENMYVRAFDGQDWSVWDQFVIAGPILP